MDYQVLYGGLTRVFREKLNANIPHIDLVVSTVQQIVKKSWATDYWHGPAAYS